MKNRLRNHTDWYLVGILVLATFLYGWGIWDAGSANSYYTAAITSMTQSWHNFWYGAFDPAGFITVDKPPIALWFMAISAKIFGVHGWSVVLPSVLAGIGSVFLLYQLLTPKFGLWAGRLAALVMTLTPTVVANSRANNMDAILVFFLLLAVWVLMKAVSRQRFWLVLLAFAIVGIAFNIKMLQAFMILPAMLVFYWLATKLPWKKKVLWLLAAMASLGLFTVAYPAAVDSVSSSSRPYIGSSQTNSLMELAFGYNGTERLLGQTSGTGGSFGGMGKNNKQSKNQQKNNNNQAPTGTPGTQKPTGTKAPSAQTTNNKMNGQAPNGQAQQGNPPQKPSKRGTQSQNGQQPSGQMGKSKNFAKGAKGGMGGGNSAFAIGSAGPFRLFQSDLGSQIGWFLPFAFLGMGLGYWAFRKKGNKWYQISDEQKDVLLWAAWFVPVYGFFSVASFFHPYYTIMLAPAIAALTAIAAAAVGRMVQEKEKKESSLAKALLALTIVSAAALQAYYAWSYFPVAASLILILSLAVAALWLIPGKWKTRHKVFLTIAVLSALSGFWALTPTLAHKSAAIPAASPSLLSQKGSSDMGGSVDSALLSYTKKHQGSAKYLFATTDSNSASGYIIKSGQAVMALGGYNGTDPTMTLTKFKKLVKEGQIKYFVVGNTKSSTGNIAKILSWVQKNGSKVSYSSQSEDSTNQTNQMPGQNMGGQNGTATLYDLSQALN
ncbi:glycosyltransferase family 39 protein [Fructobacillus sp. M1-13]|uniref:Glycosyltransferase family 39 protein n=1 Tax=Fructobacillus papyriferae TaxID=2713171 RepID=A0ABS5QQ12_9LACO|nr:glycosyltransferase family 39 protein [Fructobacillus papyriferae]MBS9335274.1 glycosyltransferase family 39 protein [Fructobacillus papyriferae]MCD2159057.1 glycosyltransferase family 39 protein [Fructobacillus papyriferae]